MHLTSESCCRDKPWGLILTTMFILLKRVIVLQRNHVGAHAELKGSTADKGAALQDTLDTLYLFSAQSLEQSMELVKHYEESK